MKKSKTSTKNGLRMCKDGTMEPLRQQSEIKLRMFQFSKMGKKRSKRKR